MSRVGGVGRQLGLVLGIVVVVGFSATPSSVEARTTPYRVGGRMTLDTNLLSKSGLSVWAIDEYLASSTTMPGLGATFLAAEHKYGINARFLIAAALHESGWGSSYIARSKHNLFGYNAYDRCASACATRFRNHAAGINEVAAFMKRSYLVRSGRWWSGAPTLRAMQKCWSSSGTWGKNVVGIANSLHFASLKSRAVKLDQPSVRGTLHGGSDASFDLGWKGRLPSGITFVATWTAVQLDRDVDLVIAPADLTATPSSSPAAASGTPEVKPSPTPAAVAVAPPKPFVTKAVEKPISASKARLTVRTPVEPGIYRVTFEARDQDGSPLPVHDRMSTPAIEARVWGAHGITYSVEPSADRSSAVATVTNMGTVAIPAFEPGGPVAASSARDALLASERAPTPVTRFIVHALAGPSDRVGHALANIVLTADLAPGASVSATFPSPSATASAASIYLVAEVRILDDPSRAATPRAQGFWLPVSAPVTQVAGPVVALSPY